MLGHLLSNIRQYYRWIAVEAVGLAIEVALWALSVALIWGLQMRLHKRAMILASFGCRLLYVIPPYRLLPTL